MWKCPNCEDEINYIEYKVRCKQIEYGIAYLTKDERERCKATDHENQDLDEYEWTEEPEYDCPLCGERITLELIIEEEDNNDDNNENTTKRNKPIYFPEEKHNIISPKITISEENIRDISYSNIMCKKCNHIHVNEEPEKAFIECPKCGELNSKEEFKKLLKNNYFNKKHVKKQNKHKHGNLMGK